MKETKAHKVLINIEEMTILEMGALMEKGEVTARGLCETYLARIERLDGLVNAVIELNPEALAIADKLDKERAAGCRRSNSQK